ncbi:MAG: hypothetical protein A2268_16360 [Candidatus Raymondbacteria bacterium RifOxyA12_full_50_37]|uniref:Outer membrane protein beta-barrel domain-containing protein n=1 Tax=Candidatus Raymondbacteria bacterium RIFOXYD12_FULL_49_13 TaxID=1817890 RepID=A0A1F7F881_UNCRA|nr:MAG: hypothetical protein A2268_16360 [Candidatus Raymondbacteria bacterium RifOxyA12_full_50_37]OGJ94371.1 MAG: hypothetical protein A2248_14555 [Candidatus Raymondbacteria bacterium RIFOXYA2_FULL_49_16]OGJ95132.1 MAG: hypothetical protein A2350_09310 [Candidatus Raymondbacteria bacterium RifOxyB12_full_50_8]OGJ95313.1 MAG: hypothetical protein A2453_05980 [Candidatus Raymondbacteria bacterium RIFOXYC2_FULL_50_21]OGJ99801.1 MAG: hypothetical protein A2487_10710 [Candidatus Raymondbacteria b
MKKLPLFALYTLMLGITSHALLNNIKDPAASIRLERKMTLSLELAWNGLAGVGPVLSYYPIPKFGLDCGLGLGGAGYKLGIRGRYLFKNDNLTPFIGAGATMGTGTMGQEAGVNDQGSTIKVKMKSCPYILLGGGLENISQGGFFFQFHLGYALLLGDDKIEYTQGTPSSTMKKSLDLSVNGGVSIGLNVGYAFR